MRRILLIVAILLVPIIPIVLVVTGVLKSNPTTVRPVTLTVWATEDQEKSFQPAMKSYTAGRPFVTLKYVKVRPEDYFQQLVTSWAQGKGPDIYFVPNTWIGQMTQYSVPMPADLSVPLVKQSKGILGANSRVIPTTQPAPSVTKLQNDFVEAAVSDMVQDGQVWGLPLAMDTIVLYYNKDLLSNAKVFEPAKTWNDLLAQIDNNHLTIVDDKNTLVQSGVALGTATNVPYASDLVTLLIMQNGSAMLTHDKKAAFTSPSGATAVTFYTSFAQSTKTSYSWNNDQPNALDAFLQGKVVYYFGTLADRTKIAASHLAWGVTSMLHLRPEGDNDATTNTQRFIDATRFQVGMVSKSASVDKKTVTAWNFLRFLSQENNVKPYLAATGKLSALKHVLNAQKDDPDLGVYAGQLLTAKTWYHGQAGASLDGYFQNMVTSIVTNKSTVSEALGLAAQQVESTL